MTDYRLTIADKTHPQEIKPKTWTELKFTDDDQGFSAATRFKLWQGRTHVVVWVSSNWPVDPQKQKLVDAINAVSNGTPAWQSAMEAAVKFLLKDEPPTWKFRMVRIIPNSPDDVTGRDVIYVAEVTDWAALFDYELSTEEVGELYSIEVWHNSPAPVVLDARIVHFTRILYDVR